MFDSITDKINSTGQFFDQNLGTIGGVVSQAKALAEKDATKAEKVTVTATTGEKQAIESAKAVPVWAWAVIGALALVVVVGGLFAKK